MDTSSLQPPWSRYYLVLGDPEKHHSPPLNAMRHLQGFYPGCYLYQLTPLQSDFER